MLSVFISDPNSQSSQPEHFVIQILLCSLGGEIFPREADPVARQQLGLAAAGDQKTAYLRRVMSLPLAWAANPNPTTVLEAVAQNGEARLLDACR